MLYRIENGTLSLGGQAVLSHIDFEVKGTEKIAVVGRNGAGKTTLLRLIAGELELDRDDRRLSPGIVCPRRMTVGFLRQSGRLPQDRTVEELLLDGGGAFETFSRERFAYEAERDKLFTGLGFAKEDRGRRLSDFSGGQQARIALIHVLLQKPELLLLDEPTNHLDVRAVEWLEGYLKGYGGAVVMVSHDRFFLDRVAGAVYELESGILRRYPGNYTCYREQKRKDLRLRQRAYERQQEEIRRLEDLVERFKHKPTKAAFARSRRSILNRMERLPKPEGREEHIFTGELDPMFPGSKWTVEAERLKVGYDKPLFELSLRVRRGQKIGIVGENGVGKSALLKTLAGLLEPLGGKYVLGSRTLLGYFDQHTAELSPGKQVAEHFMELFPGMTQKQVRQTLGAYLFQGKEACKRVDDLSGGEKARLVLAELLTGRPNLLLLDEPTNHMDIPARETFEAAFKAYTGTVLFISHDRYLTAQLADAILVIDGHSVMYYPFGYEHYLERSKEGENPAAMILAKEQAMLADLKAVPKAERHILKEQSTEAAYLEWRLRLAAEPMEEARARVEKLWEMWMENEFRPAAPGEAERLKAALEAAWERWTEMCLNWYDATLL